MARSVDPYSVCLCGSGLKTKFCCHKIVEDMCDVYDALSQNRVPLAKTLLAKARAKAGGQGYPSAWVETVAAAIVGIESSPANAVPLMDQVIARQPDFAFAYETRAEELGKLGRLDESYDSLDAALSRTTTISSSLTRTIANLATRLERSGEPLAALFLMTVATATAKGTDREEMSRQVLMFRDNRRLPIVLRSVPVRRHIVNDGYRSLREKAFESSRRGAMRSAIAPLQQVAEKSNSYDDWWQLATHLCCAARSREAIVAFRRAAELAPDFELGVEAETFAQVLHRQVDGAKTETVSVAFDCTSPTELSHALDRDPRVRRTPVPSTGAGASNAISRWLLASKPVPELEEGQPLTDLPLYLGEINLFPPGSGGVGGVGATVGYSLYLSANSLSGPIEVVEGLVTEIGGAWLRRGDTQRGIGAPVEQARLERDHAFPINIGPADQIARRRAVFDNMVHELWAKHPLDGLGGRTPVEVQGQPEAARALAAALLFLVDDLERYDCYVDEAKLREEFGLPPITPIPGQPGLNLHALLVLATRRLTLQELSDDQLSQLIERLLPLQSPAINYRLIVEQDRREAGNAVANAEAYLRLAALAKQVDRPVEALQFIQRVRSLPQESRSFDNRFQTDYLELSIHGTDRKLPETIEIAHRIWTEFLPKMPESRRMLCERLKGYAGDGPWDAVLADKTA
jgi:tetratricopeptide (TPR) repeat protein